MKEISGNFAIYLDEVRYILGSLLSYLLMYAPIISVAYILAASDDDCITVILLLAFN